MKNLIFCALVLLLFCSSVVIAADTLRIASYNLLNYPGTDAATRNPHFRVVLNHMKPHVIVTQETQSQAGVDGFRTNVLNYYQAGKFASVPFHDGYDSDNALFYDTSKVIFISANYLTTTLRDIAEYVIKPKWSGEQLRIYSVHLKASDNQPDEQQRAAECTVLRNHLNNLPAGTNFIIVGDFNTYKSSDLGLQVLLSSATNNNGRAKDPLNLIGTWNKNSAFKAYHTQSPRVRSFGGGTSGGMDDRFDMILTSYSSLDDNILVSTYKAYGNDGNHFNDSINRLPNSAVPDSVANGLHYAADHLPVVCNFVFPETTAAVMTTMNLHDGWNIVSLPLTPNNANKAVVFPTSTSSAYYFSGTNGYLFDATLRTKVGYWLKFPAEQEIQLTGKPRGSDTITVTAGWNLIGAADHDVPLNQLVVQPSGIIESEFFDFNDGYFIADTIKRGGGYFVKVNANGKIILP